MVTSKWSVEVRADGAGKSRLSVRNNEGAGIGKVGDLLIGVRCADDSVTQQAISVEDWRQMVADVEKNLRLREGTA